jgi:hypothetical protein
VLIRNFVPWIALVSILGFALGGSYVWTFLEPRAAAVHQQHAESNEHSPESKAAEEKEKTDRLLADYTYWLMLFTGLLALASIGLGVATYGLSPSRSPRIQIGVT